MKQTATNSRLQLLRTALCTGITAAVMAIAPQSFGQASTCNPAGPTITISPAATTFAVGQKPRINVQFGTSTIEGGTQAEITTLQVSLDCASGTNPCSICNDEGQTIRYSGDATIDFADCGGITEANVTSNVPAGGAATNVIVFTFNPPIVLAPNQTCNLSFEVEVLAVGGDGSPKVINGFAEFEGECDNEAQFLNGCGTYSYPITNPGIQVIKSVDDDDICEGDSVNYTYAVSIPAPFNTQLCNIVLEDDNATPGNTADDFNPTYTGGDTNGNSCLDVGETWTYSHGPVQLNTPGTVTNIATVSGDYTNAAGTITKTDTDDADVEVNPNPTCSITPTPTTCAVVLCVDTNACFPYEVCWSYEGVEIIDSCVTVNNAGEADNACLTLDANDPAGEYCAIVTDCNGCTSEGNSTPCCYDFTPPVAPSCTISVGACPFPRLLTVNPVNCTNCTYQWGNGPANACVPIVGATGSTYSAPAPGTYCVTITSHCATDGLGCNNDGCSSTCEVVVGECETGEGCTPGYWRQEQHFWAWVGACPSNAYCGDASEFDDIFGVNAFPTSCGGESKTMLKVLRQPASEWPAGCGSNALNNLGRHLVAAYLNAGQDLVAFPIASQQEVIDMFLEVYPGTNAEYNELKNELAAYNEAGCPIGNAPPPSSAVIVDLNNDGRADITDINALLSRWGQSGTGDLNHDGKIDSTDLMMLLQSMATSH